MSKLSKKIVSNIPFIPDVLNGDLEQLSTEEANKLEGGGETDTEHIKCTLGCGPNTGCTNVSCTPIDYVCKSNA
jgi:hypothetical protein